MAVTARPTWGASALWALVALVCFCVTTAPARASDPAVAFMEKVARELLTASRSKSPALVAAVVHRYADTSYIGSYSLGSYRNQLTPADRPGYLSGMVRFIGRYAANESPKYPVASYRITGSVRGGQVIMVDSVITMRDGSSYDVRWLLSQTGGTYRVRDAMVYGFWMLPFLRKLFENYIAENGGHVRALVAVLSR
ncbi:MAG: ABC transporter substrate-binding protein [Hyphomicrobiaceae bacterium]